MPPDDNRPADDLLRYRRRCNPRTGKALPTKIRPTAPTHGCFAEDLNRHPLDDGPHRVGVETVILYGDERDLVEPYML